MDRSSILRASTIYDQGEPFHEGFAFFVAPSWGDTMTSRKEAGAFRGRARLPGAGSVSRQHSPNWTPLPRNRASVPRERRSMPRERPIPAVRGWMVPSGGRGTASRGRPSPAARDSDPRPRQQPAATRERARTSGRPAIRTADRRTFVKSSTVISANGKRDSVFEHLLKHALTCAFTTMQAEADKADHLHTREECSTTLATRATQPVSFPATFVTLIYGGIP